jgi:protein SCO1/2
MVRTFAVVAVFASVSFLAVIAYLGLSRDSEEQFAQCREGQVAGGASSIGGPFELVSETGETVTDKDVITEPTLLYFGYTFCPDVCPLDTARNAEVAEILEQRGIMVQPAMISIDPARDTPEVLAEFTDYLHPRMIGLTGSAQQVKAASSAYRTYYKKQEAEDEYYLVDHSTFTYLVLPEHGFVEYFRRDVEPDAMAKRVSCFINNS